MADESDGRGQGETEGGARPPEGLPEDLREGVVAIARCVANQLSHGVDPVEARKRCQMPPKEATDKPFHGF